MKYAIFVCSGFPSISLDSEFVKPLNSNLRVSSFVHPWIQNLPSLKFEFKGFQLSEKSNPLNSNLRGFSFLRGETPEIRI